MRLNVTVAVLAALVATPTVLPDTAVARHYGGHPYYGGHRYYRGHPYYRGHATYYRRCSGGDGAVGTVAGGAGGALIGHAVGGGTLGTIGGGIAGALLGRTLDKENTRSRHGC